MSDTLAAARASQQAPSFINLNAATAYQQELGFYVAVDGACRLGRLLPTAALISLSPPGSLYQVGDMEWVHEWVQGWVGG